jgi:hypothetical protein
MIFEKGAHDDEKKKGNCQFFGGAALRIGVNSGKRLCSDNNANY